MIDQRRRAVRLERPPLQQSRAVPPHAGGRLQVQLVGGWQQGDRLALDRMRVAIDTISSSSTTPRLIGRLPRRGGGARATGRAAAGRARRRASSRSSGRSAGSGRCRRCAAARSACETDDSGISMVSARSQTQSSPASSSAWSSRARVGSASSLNRSASRAASVGVDQLGLGRRDPVRVDARISQRPAASVLRYLHRCSYMTEIAGNATGRRSQPRITSRRRRRRGRASSSRAPTAWRAGQPRSSKRWRRMRCTAAASPAAHTRASASIVRAADRGDERVARAARPAGRSCHVTVARRVLREREARRRAARPRRARAPASRRASTRGAG